MNEAIVLDKPEQIERYRLAVLRSAVKLEMLGMKRKGRSATVCAKEQLGLPRNTKREEIIKILTEMIG